MRQLPPRCPRRGANPRASWRADPGGDAVRGRTLRGRNGRTRGCLAGVHARFVRGGAGGVHRRRFIRSGFQPGAGGRRFIRSGFQPGAGGRRLIRSGFQPGAGGRRLIRSGFQPGAGGRRLIRSGFQPGAGGRRLIRSGFQPGAGGRRLIRSGFQPGAGGRRFIRSGFQPGAGGRRPFRRRRRARDAYVRRPGGGRRRRLGASVWVAHTSRRWPFRCCGDAGRVRRAGDPAAAASEEAVRSEHACERKSSSKWHRNNLATLSRCSLPLECTTFLWGRSLLQLSNCG